MRFLVLFFLLSSCSLHQAQESSISPSDSTPVISTCEGPINVSYEQIDFFLSKGDYDGRIYYKVEFFEEGSHGFLTWQNKLTGKDYIQSLKAIEGYEIVCSSFEFTEDRLLKVYHHTYQSNQNPSELSIYYKWKGNKAGKGQFVEVIK